MTLPLTISRIQLITNSTSLILKLSLSLTKKWCIWTLTRKVCTHTPICAKNTYRRRKRKQRTYPATLTNCQKGSQKEEAPWTCKTWSTTTKSCQATCNRALSSATTTRANLPRKWKISSRTICWGNTTSNRNYAKNSAKFKGRTKRAKSCCKVRSKRSISASWARF